MQIGITKKENTAVLKLEGRFDFNAHRDFRAAYEGVLPDEAVRTLEIDMSTVVYMDSSALGMLLMLRDKARNSAKEVVLSNCSASVRQVLDIANFGKLFTIR